MLQTIGGIVCLLTGVPCALFAAWSLFQALDMIGEHDGFGLASGFRAIAWISTLLAGIAATALFTLAYLAFAK